MSILDSSGNPIDGSELGSNCDHGITFNEAAANAILEGWQPTSATSFIMGNPAAAAVRKRWPRLHGVCPKGCGYNGIAYASTEHYAAGDW